MLHDYQKDICRRLAEAWKSHRSVMVQMPTGTGKTHVLAAVVSDCLCRSEGTVWIVAHRRELVEQAERTLGRYDVGGDKRRVRIMAIQWLSRHVDELTDRPALVVVDEAHHALAKTYKMLWDKCPQAKFLGLTATPCRLSGEGFTDLFDVLLTSWSVSRFIREGRLSLFDYYSVRTNSEDRRLISQLTKRGADGDYQTKELDALLNRRPSISRLYDSARRYADGKKGIVYAISIDHARNIAAYYSERGINAVAIDSKTPMEERRRIIERFKNSSLTPDPSNSLTPAPSPRGRGVITSVGCEQNLNTATKHITPLPLGEGAGVRLLVSVDLFSEGFDCPDVEFIQIARPTLSLAKYLQMVGRGLRRSEGKESCVIIDNVGLYHMFGLPAADHDWQAMFEGRIAGRGHTDRRLTTENNALTAGKSVDGYELSANTTAMSAVTTADGTAVTSGEELEEVITHERLLEYLDSGKLPAPVYGGDELTAVTGNDGKRRYVDRRNGREYRHRPTVVRFGAFELLRSEGRYYDRTKAPYAEGFDKDECLVCDRGRYLALYAVAGMTEYPSRYGDNITSCAAARCLISGDDSRCYRLLYRIKGNGIIIGDDEDNIYHVKENCKPRLIAARQADGTTVDIGTILTRLGERAAQADRKRADSSERMARLRQAEPFRSGMKWGLRLDGRVIVPPIYRSIRPAVGNYRAVEGSPQQWGIILLDGRVVVETKYMGVEINDNGNALLTIFPGKTKTVKLRN